MRITKNISYRKRDFSAITDDTSCLDSHTLFVLSKQNARYFAALNPKPPHIHAQNLREIFALPQCIIGITGTNGKTTTATIIYESLRALGFSAALLGTRGLFVNGVETKPKGLTTPSVLELYENFELAKECAYFVMEVSSHAIAQNRVFGLPFAVTAFTNLTQDHMDYHGNMENYFAVKSRLFDGSQGAFPQAAVVNADDAWGRRLLKNLPPQTRAVPFGLDAPADFRGNAAGFFAENVELGAGGSAFLLRCPAGTFSVRTRLPGDYNVSNALCALALVGALGGNVARAVRDVADFPGVPGRMERVPDNPFPFDVFVDYAHTDDALKNALGMLKKIARGRVLAVFGCGGNRDRGKRPKMTDAVQRLADFAWATSDNPRKEPLEQIFADMKAGVSAPERIVFEPDRRRAIALALDAARAGDCVLIAGKGHETYQEFADITLPFDDKETARELLALKSCRVAGTPPRS